MTPSIVARIRGVARSHGWAIGEHGTMVRDIDLIAVPWTDDASPLLTLVGAIERVVDIALIGDPAHGGLSAKPHGRRSGSFEQPGSRMTAIIYNERGESGKVAHDPPHIDLSFIDPREGITP